jgi:hypothetical protein
MRAKRIIIGAIGALSSLAMANSAFASGIETPDSGTVQLGRGATYVARADDPLAAAFNPAGLAFQKSGVYVGVFPAETLMVRRFLREPDFLDQVLPMVRPILFARK